MVVFHVWRGGTADSALLRKPFRTSETLDSIPKRKYHGFKAAQDSVHPQYEGVPKGLSGGGIQTTGRGTPRYISESDESGVQIMVGR